MARLILSVLGELQVLVDDVPVSSFESDKVRALLAYLAVEAGRSHRRETLVGLLWPDSPEQDARHNLSQALFNLRLALGDHTARPPYLLITRHVIQINRESDYSLDLDQFNAYFSAWEKVQGRESVDPSDLLPQLEEMIQLYRGEFLQQFYLKDSAEYEDWILVQREALHQRAMNVVTSLANEYELRENFQAARRYAMRQLELDPWREEAHCQVMRLLALDGQRSAALAQFESCRKLLAEELGVEPSKKTRDLYEQLRSGAFKPKAEPPTSVSSAPPHKLPVPLTPFIGREQELADLAQLIINPECRCITLVGPGGIGKTRLALQTANQHAYKFTQGSAFIPLASVGSIEAIIPAIANGIGFAFNGPADPKIQLLNHLREKQMLLVVDNVEHLLVEGPHQRTIADLLIEVMQAAGQVKLLVTSREAMNLQGEWIFEVPGLAFPGVEQVDKLDEYSAVALFVQRARRSRPGFEMNAEDMMWIVRICRLVEGLPLAIELAAAWVRILSPVEIAQEIEISLDFLNAQMRDLPERHRSMRAVFDHSWQMLSTEEKKVLSRLSVFRGGFQRQAAEQVAGASLPILSSLVIRSLLRRTATGRYDLHELIRQYAASKLGEDPSELQSVQERHSLCYLGLLDENGVKLKSHAQKEAVADLTVEMDNIRVAWDWSIANRNFIPLYRFSETLGFLFELLSWFKEGETTFLKAAEGLRKYMEETPAEDAVLRTALHSILSYYGYFTFRLGRAEEAYATLAPSAAILRAGSQPFAATNSLYSLGIVCWILGRYSEAEKSLQGSLAFARESGDLWYEAMASEWLGIVALGQGDYDQARQYISEALTKIRPVGDPSRIAHVLSYLGRTMHGLGEFREAEKLLRESLELAREIDYRVVMGLALDGLGRVAYSQGNHEEASAFFLESADLFREMGDTHRQSRTLNHQGFNSLALGDTADAQNAFRAALVLAQEGGSLPSALNALAGIAALETRKEARQRTLDLVTCILEHPSSTKETKMIASQLRVELEARLTQPRARSKSYDELVRQVMADV